MSFETNGQKHIDKLVKQRARLFKRRVTLLSREHDCDCEFCDRQGMVNFTPAEKKWLSGVDARIAEIDDMIGKVKRHCEAAGIKLEVPA